MRVPTGPLLVGVGSCKVNTFFDNQRTGFENVAQKVLMLRFDRVHVLLFGGTCSIAISRVRRVPFISISQSSG
jgi:hypothetical protein